MKVGGWKHDISSVWYVFLVHEDVSYTSPNEWSFEKHAQRFLTAEIKYRHLRFYRIHRKQGFVVMIASKGVRAFMQPPGFVLDKYFPLRVGLQMQEHPGDHVSSVAGCSK
jgi:hypothetical protein